MRAPSSSFQIVVVTVRTKGAEGLAKYALPTVVSGSHAYPEKRLPTPPRTRTRKLGATRFQGLPLVPGANGLCGRVHVLPALFPLMTGVASTVLVPHSTA